MMARKDDYLTRCIASLVILVASFSVVRSAVESGDPYKFAGAALFLAIALGLYFWKIE